LTGSGAAARVLDEIARAFDGGSISALRANARTERGAGCCGDEQRAEDSGSMEALHVRCLRGCLMVWRTPPRALARGGIVAGIADAPTSSRDAPLRTKIAKGAEASLERSMLPVIRIRILRLVPSYLNV
jgi:hypothetical protein